MLNQLELIFLIASNRALFNFVIIGKDDPLSIIEAIEYLSFPTNSYKWNAKIENRTLLVY